MTSHSTEPPAPTSDGAAFEDPTGSVTTTVTHPLLQIDNLTKLYPLPRRWLMPQRFVRALDDVSLYLHPGETLGVIGETGSGKSTLSRCVLRLVEPDFGQIAFEGELISELAGRALRPIRRRLQPIFQDPRASLDPRLSVSEIVAEGVLAHRRAAAVDVRERSARWISRVGLTPDLAARRPGELSAGERQRVAIARALAVEPSLVVCDEPLNALDVSVRARIVNLLLDLQDELGLGYLFISHDIRVVRYLSHRVAVMHLGRIVETGAVADVCEFGAHPYTRALLNAVPETRPGRKRLRILTEGAPPDPSAPPPGCSFHPRCPRAEPGRCDRDVPELHELESGSAHFVACHFPHRRV